jgi:glycosyltransferase A (GT-A) superfamily protein (DUF2064 family)
MAERRVVIFARAPRYGAVKSRLARDVGNLEALGFHRAALASLLRTVGTDPRWFTIVAVTPDFALSCPGWAGSAPMIAQGIGDLGRRMIRAMRGIHPPCPTVVIGSDIPGITPAGISAAFRALGSAAYALGPAVDGGYWLIGARHPNRLRIDVLDGVRWSTRHARADTIARLGAANVALLPFELEDIDDGDAYRRWRAHKRN